MGTINTKSISEIAERSPTAEAFFTYAACRERNVREGISRLSAIRAQMAKEGFQPVPQDLLVMFRELEQQGIGKLQGNLFKWNVSIKKVGEAANPASEALVVKTHEKPKREVKTLVICFESGKEVSVTLSEPLTKEEASLVANKLVS